MLLKSFRNLFFQEGNGESPDLENSMTNEGELDANGERIMQIIEQWSNQLDVNPLANLYQLKVPLYESLLRSQVLAPIRTQSADDGILSLIAVKHNESPMIPVYATRNALGYNCEVDPARFTWMSFIEVARLAIRQQVQSVHLNPDGPIPIPFSAAELEAFAEGKLPAPPDKESEPLEVFIETANGLQFFGRLKEPFPQQAVEQMSQFFLQEAQGQVTRAYLFQAYNPNQGILSHPAVGVLLADGQDAAYEENIKPQLLNRLRENGVEVIECFFLNAEPNLEAALQTFTEPFFKTDE